MINMLIFFIFELVYSLGILHCRGYCSRRWWRVEIARALVWSTLSYVDSVCDVWSPFQTEPEPRVMKSGLGSHDDHPPPHSHTVVTSQQRYLTSNLAENENAEMSASHQPKRDFTILMRLAISKNYDELTSFLENIDGKLLFHKDYKGRTALDWARMQNNQQSTHLISQAMSKELNKVRMEKAGYVISSESTIRATNHRLTNLLSDAFLNRDSVAILKILLDSQLSREVVEDIEGEVYFTDFTTIEGDTPLIRAAGWGMYDVVIELLTMGVNINTPNRYGHNPLTWACVGGHSDIVRTLLQKGADFNHQTNEKRTCLHYACLYLKSRVVSVILDVLFEKFSMFRVNTHPFTKYDPLRWRKYADILERFLMVSVRDIFIDSFSDSRF